MSERLLKFRVSLIVVLPIIGVGFAAYYLWNSYFFLSDAVIFAGSYLLTMLGVTIGFHRLLTHDGFDCPRVIKALFIILGSMAFEGRPIQWAAMHIKHHAHSDHEGDPHSPLEGFWHAHVGWLFEKKNYVDPKKYAPKLLEDPTVVWVDRYTPLWMTLSLLLPYLLGGWTGFIWGGAVRVFMVTHVTWSVNSVCHTFGHRVYETTDESKNHWIVGLLAFGEGWHNNHHAFPRNAFHGMRWWQFDLSGLLIRGLELIGLAKNVQRVSPQTRKAKKEKYELRAKMKEVGEMAKKSKNMITPVT